MAKKAKDICSANLKGGVGKTTWVVTTADALAREKKLVLVIDLDGQANTTRSLALSDEPPSISVADVMLANDPQILERAIRKQTKIDFVHHLPARYKLHSHSFAEELRTTAANAYKVLRRRIEPLLSIYDFILIDTPPRIDLVTLNGLAASDAYVVPFLSGDIYALDGMDDMEAAINRFVKDEDVNPDLELLGAVLQAHSSKNKANRVTEQLILDRGYTIFGAVPNNTHVKQAAMMHQTVMQFSRTSTAACAYADMAKKLLEHFNLPAGNKAGRKSSRSTAVSEN